MTLGDEWRFVSRYLAVEQIRFGERLLVRADLPDGVLDERVPALALQTLVENAVRHGAAPRVAPTEIVVTAAGSASGLTLSVWNTGNGAPADLTTPGAGTGLARLRERLAVLYGSAARLSSGPAADGGCEAVLVVPGIAHGNREGQHVHRRRRAGRARWAARDARGVRLGGCRGGGNRRGVGGAADQRAAAGARPSTCRCRGTTSTASNPPSAAGPDDTLAAPP